ncbi:MAG: hypothetical protein II502_00470, partial [Paludibacteraceae bacterium]|nr:hypothetical protein [Paludibacteraceae bacterium]
MKIIHKTVLLLASLFTLSLSILAQQVPNPGFEDWSGDKFDGNVQPASWYASNVTQVGFKFNFAHQEAGHTGKYSMMVQDQTVGAAGITETSPGYFSLGQSWVYLESVLKVKEATAGICGGIQWQYRPDSVSVWIKRTGNDVLKENFNIIYYAWRGTARGEKYRGKNGGCTSTSRIDEESDVRQALDANECGTIQKAEQIAEGWLYQKKEYSNWTNIRIPIYYMNNNVPEKMNIIFSASNYPNYRSSAGLYSGNSLYVDDVELIYSAQIQTLYIDNKEWKGFDPNSTDEQIYSLGEQATSIPPIEARRGKGTLTDNRGGVVNFPGRVLQGNEIKIIEQGEIDGDPMVIEVTSEDGKKKHTYKIKFIREASSNSRLAGIEVNGKPIEDFNRTNINYNFALPYGTTEAPVVTVTKGEDAQKVEITQPNSVTGTAIIKVTAADKKTTTTYSIQFSVAELSDNTLQDILVNGSSLTGFDPLKTLYRVSLPLGTTEMPTIQAVSAYPEGEQTIRYNAPNQIDGGMYTVSVSTPGNKVEKVYKLNLKLEASSYSLLKSLSMEGGYIQDFEPENTTYYINLPLGTMALPKIEYVAGDSYQTIEVQEGGLDGTTRVIVKAADGSTTTYKIVVTTEKSTRTDLQDILIGGVSLAEFESNKFVYSYELPIGTTLEQFPAIDVVKGDEYEQVTITYGGVNGTTRISVKAGDGSVSIYQILFSVKKATDATLKSITVGGVEIPNYDKTVLEYDYMLPRGTKELPLVSYVPNDEYQIINTRPDGVNGDYKIIVRPQSGVSQTYIIHFTVEVSTNNFLESILVNNTELSDFDPEQTAYSYTLEPGVSSIPQNIVYKQPEGENQKAFAFAEDMVYTIRVTAENGDVRDYIITFVVQKSENAFLENILLDGVSLEGFNKETLTYTYQLTDETCPKVTVQSTEGQQVVITQPNGAGVAKILVTPEVGAPNMYQITFVKPVKNTVQLADILMDGVSIDGFDPTKKDYIYTYSKGNPVVTFAKADESQDVQLFVQQQKVFLYVTDGKENNAYTVELKKDLNASTALKSLKVGGVEYKDYKPETTQYYIYVPAGNKNPSIEYEPNDTTQVIWAGATSP